MLGKKKKERREKSPFDLIDEAFHLLRQTPISILLFYYIGSIPFTLAFLFFWTDMSKSGSASTHLFTEPVLLAFLFIWMKVFQSRFSWSLEHIIRLEKEPKFTLSRWIKCIGEQSFIQTIGLIIIPLSLFILIPFPAAYAFFQNITILGNGSGLKRNELIKKASNLALKANRQNLILTWILNPWSLFMAAFIIMALYPIINQYFEYLTFLFPLMLFFSLFTMTLISPLGAVVSINISLVLFTLPYLIKMLFGFESVFTLSPTLFMNSTFLATVCGLTYLTLDPLIKAAYTLRCFYGSTQKTGLDIIVFLKKATKTAIVIFIIFLPLTAKIVYSKPLTKNKLNNLQTTISQKKTLGKSEKIEKITGKSEKIETVTINAAQIENFERECILILNEREFSWRLAKPYKPSDNSIKQFLREYVGKIKLIVKSWFKKISKLLERFFDWIKKLFAPFDTNFMSKDNQYSTLQKISAFLQLILLLIVAVLVTIIILRIRKKVKKRVIKSEVPVMVDIDIEAEDIRADILPEDEWMRLARQNIDQGNYRFAIRALYLAILASLGKNNIIALHISKSDREYEREILNHKQAFPEIATIFSELVVQFERIWYGTYHATSELANRFISFKERIAVYVNK